MTRLITFLFLLIGFTVQAATSSRIAVEVEVTNTPVSGATFALNGAVRMWTNAHSSTTILTNLTSVNGSATNLFNNYASYPVGSGITHVMTATNKVKFTGPLGLVYTGTATGNWATITLTTQSGPTTFTALWPMENMVGETNRTNQGTSLVYGLGIYSTEAFPTNSTATSNYVTKGAHPGQTISSALTIGGATRVQSGFYATNGFTSAMTNINPVISNGVNYGTAFSSPGAYLNSQQFGGGAAGGGNATTIGYSSVAATSAVAVGYFASAGRFGVAIGSSADSSAGTNSIAIGQGASVASASNAVALGNSTVIGDRHHNSIAIGYAATSTTNDQVILGASTHTVIVPGMISAASITNANIRGTNTVNAITVYTPTANTALANGYNSGVAINATYVRFSGPSGAYTNVGFSAANKMDGKWAFCQFDNPGLSFTILHDSGLDSGDTNRVYTGTGALLNSTNNPACVILNYDNAVTRWRVWSFR